MFHSTATALVTSSGCRGSRAHQSQSTRVARETSSPSRASAAQNVNPQAGHFEVLRLTEGSDLQRLILQQSQEFFAGTDQHLVPQLPQPSLLRWEECIEFSILFNKNCTRDFFPEQRCEIYDYQSTAVALKSSSLDRWHGVQHLVPQVSHFAVLPWEELPDLRFAVQHYPIQPFFLRSGIQMIFVESAGIAI